jgi:hypothetical protein
MKPLFVIVICFFSQLSLGQELLPIGLDTTDQSRHISLQGSAFYLSSGIQNDVASKLLFGGSISDQDKLASLEEHDDINRLGGDVSVRAQYFSNQTLIKKWDHLSWMIDAGFETHFSAQYATSLYGLAFFGNDYYRGETANFSNSFGRLQSFYTIGFGLYENKTKSRVVLSAILPTGDAYFSADRGTLYTSIDGDTVNLAMTGEVRQSNSPAFFQGIGAALNFDFKIPFTMNSGSTGFFSITGQNLGAYYLNSVSELSFETVMQFDGYSLADIADIEGNGGSVLEDSLNVVRNSASGWRMLPGFIQVGKLVEKYTDKQIQAFYGVRMYTNSVYRPLAYAGVHWNPTLKLALGAQVSFGGYGNFRGGIYAGYTGDHLSISLGTEDVVGVLFGSQFGKSALIRMSWNI